MEVKILKARIVKKFGSVNRFCNISGTNYQTLQNLFRQSDSKFKQIKLKELSGQVTRVKVAPLEGVDITNELLEKIRVAIVTKYKTYQEFCVVNHVSNTWLSALLNGKHRLVSNRVKSLCDILSIEIKQ